MGDSVDEGELLRQTDRGQVVAGQHVLAGSFPERAVGGGIGQPSGDALRQTIAIETINGQPVVAIANHLRYRCCGGADQHGPPGHGLKQWATPHATHPCQISSRSICSPGKGEPASRLVAASMRWGSPLPLAGHTSTAWCSGISSQPSWAPLAW